VFSPMPRWPSVPRKDDTAKSMPSWALRERQNRSRRLHATLRDSFSPLPLHPTPHANSLPTLPSARKEPRRRQRAMRATSPTRIAWRPRRVVKSARSATRALPAQPCLGHAAQGGSEPRWARPASSAPARVCRATSVLREARATRRVLAPLRGSTPTTVVLAQPLASSAREGHTPPSPAQATISNAPLVRLPLAPLCILHRTGGCVCHLKTLTNPLFMRGAWGGRSPPLLGANVVTAVRRVGSVLSYLSFP